MRFLPLALLIVLAGCADQAAPPEIPYYQNAEDDMIGMSRDEIFTCLGAPGKKAETDASGTWDYDFGTCTVHLTVGDNGKVKMVTDTFKTVKDKPSDPDLPDEEEQCSHIVDVIGCTRWLRGK